VETILAQGAPLPRGDIEAFFQDSAHSSRGRLLAFELLTKGNQELAESWMPRLLDDRGPPLRRMAVNWLVDQAKAADGTASLGMLTQAMTKARDPDQAQSIAKLLDERGIKIDLARQLGFVTTWKLAGPFDNSGGSGFQQAYGPEIGLDAIDAGATYEGKSGPVTWRSHNTRDEAGVVNLNEQIVEAKGVLAYAWYEFDAAEAQDVEIRIGCINAHKVWVNGQLVLDNEIYHVGMMPDQFSGPAHFEKGKNSIVVKVCQNEQPEPWANLWMFQVRVCDKLGAPVLPVPPPQPAM
jgi:hypothetical protein